METGIPDGFIVCESAQKPESPTYQHTGINNLHKDLVSFIFAPSKQGASPRF
jgi:hypothetical protein